MPDLEDDRDTATAIVLIQNFIVSSNNDSRLNMPLLTVPSNSMNQIESYSQVLPEVRGALDLSAEYRLIITDRISYSFSTPNMTVRLQNVSPVNVA